MTIPDRLTAALADRYRIERELGQGGMATVYLAEDLKHKRKVALKVLKPELAAVLGAERFVQEITTTAALQHPHILPLFDSGTADSFLFYVMPFIDGETLRAKLDRETQLGVDEAVKITVAIADALDHAHRHGVIHRDIKPENILLHEGRPMVADFGIALAVSAAAGGRMTETGLSLGTPHYMSPEQAMGERSIDARSDIYALGAVTYEMLAGEPPFTGPTVQAIVARVMSEEPRSLVQQRKAVSPMVEDTVLRALEKLPADRFATAAEYSAALGAGADGGTRATRAWPTAPGTRPGMSMVTAAAVVLGIAALWGWLRPTPVPAVIRYRLAVDSVQVLRLWSGELAISPDGSILAYAGGVNSPLMVRRRDGLDFQPMDGTGGAASPFFSPDGTQLGYFQNGKLMVAPLAGGPPVVYDDSLTTPEGAAWTEAGTILRAWKDSLGVFSIGQMVAAPGARVTPLTTVDTAAGETSHLLPEALPGKNGVLFQVAFRGGRRAIGVTGLAGGQHAILFDGDRARYARSGHLVYSTTDGSLWAVPFDAGARRVTGSPTQVGGGLPGTMVGPVNFAVSETGTLVHALETPTTRNELVWVTRGGHRTPFDTAWRAAFASPRLSPDGRRLAVTIQEAASSDIWIRPVSGGLASKLSLGTADNTEPAWSPDGRAVTYLSGLGDVWRRAAEGGASAVRLLDTDRSLSEQLWSPDGQSLVVRTGTPTLGSGDILVFPATGSGDSFEIAATSHTEYTPEISPNGRWLAYSSNETGRQEIFVVPFPQPGSTKWQVSTQGGMAPVWSPRGDELFYLDQVANLVAAQVATAPDFALRESRVLFPADGFVRTAISRRNYDVAPDGQRFLMVQPAGGAAGARLVVVENWFQELKTKTSR